MSRKVKCKYCGKRIEKINIKDHEESGCSKSPKIKGFGGWLGLFAFGLYLSTIALLYYSLVAGFLFFNILSFLHFGYFVYLLYLMHRRSKSFKRFAIYGLWIWIPILIIKLLYFAFSLTGEEEFTRVVTLLFSGAGVSLILRVVISFLWTEYLLKSKRVKNTFIK